MTRIDLNRCLTTSQAAKALGISPETVKKQCQSGRIRAHKFGRAWLIPKSAVAAYQRNRRIYRRRKSRETIAVSPGV